MSEIGYGPQGKTKEFGSPSRKPSALELFLNYSGNLDGERGDIVRAADAELDAYTDAKDRYADVRESVAEHALYLLDLCDAPAEPIQELTAPTDASERRLQASV